MEADRRLSLMVGLFVLVALGALAVALTSLTSERSLFTPQYTLVAHFDNAMGLQPGSPVWLAGKEVGRVESVKFGSGEDSQAIRVLLKIDLEVQPRIRQDSTATIDTIGLLGDSYVEVSPAFHGEMLRAGSEIRATSPLKLSAVVGKGVAALEDFSQLAGNLNRVVGTFAEADGGKRTADAISAASNIIEKIEAGEGLMHSMIYDEYTGGGVQSIERSLAHLENILLEVKSGGGLLHGLIYEDAPEENLLLEAAAAGARLNSILAKVDRGEGTLGLLVNDPSVYEDLKLLLGGAQRSAVLRTLIRLSSGDEQ